MAVGRVLRFDEVRGYGFIAPSSGGEDVFVHANDFGDHRHLVHPGMRVEYEVEEGERGLKVSTVKVLEPARPVVRQAPAATKTSSGTDDDGMCDVLTPGEYTTEITETLIQHVPTLTGAQIVQVRERLVEHARAHGWVES